MKKGRSTALSRVPRGRWGPIKVVAGPFKNRVGYLDDEDPDGIVVYLGEPLTGDYVILQRKNVRIAPHAAAQRWLKRHLPKYAEPLKRRRLKFGHLRLIDGGRKD